MSLLALATLGKMTQIDSICVASANVAKANRVELLPAFSHFDNAIILLTEWKCGLTQNKALEHRAKKFYET